MQLAELQIQRGVRRARVAGSDGRILRRIGARRPQAAEQPLIALRRRVQSSLCHRKQIAALVELSPRFGELALELARLRFGGVELLVTFVKLNGFSANFEKMVGLCGFRLLEILSDFALAKGVVGAQQIALGDRLLAREGREHLQAAHRKPRGPRP